MQPLEFEQFAAAAGDGEWDEGAFLGERTAGKCHNCSQQVSGLVDVHMDTRMCLCECAP